MKILCNKCYNVLNYIEKDGDILVGNCETCMDEYADEKWDNIYHRGYEDGREEGYQDGYDDCKCEYY